MTNRDTSETAIDYELNHLLTTTDKDTSMVRLEKDGDGVTLTGAELKQLSEDTEKMYHEI